MALNRLESAAVSAAISATLVFIVSIVTSYLSPVWGSVIWSLPFSTVAVVIGLYLSSTSTVTDIEKLLFSFCCALLPLFAFILTWALVSRTTFNEEEKLTRVWASFGVGLCAWLVLTATYLGIVYGVPQIKHSLY